MTRSRSPGCLALTPTLHEGEAVRPLSRPWLDSLPGGAHLFPELQIPEAKIPRPPTPDSGANRPPTSRPEASRTDLWMPPPPPCQGAAARIFARTWDSQRHPWVPHSPHPIRRGDPSTTPPSWPLLPPLPLAQSALPFPGQLRRPPVGLQRLLSPSLLQSVSRTAARAGSSKQEWDPVILLLWLLGSQNKTETPPWTFTCRAPAVLCA